MCIKIELREKGEMEIAQFQSDWVDYSSFFRGLKNRAKLESIKLFPPNFCAASFSRFSSPGLALSFLAIFQPEWK